MNNIKDYILEKFKINSKNAKRGFDPDDLTGDHQVLYNSEDEDDSYRDLEEILQMINDNEKYQSFIVCKFKQLSNMKNMYNNDNDIYFFNDDLMKVIDKVITGKDLGYEVKLMYGHLQVDCINSGSRGDYYIYALSEEGTEKMTLWWEGDESVPDLKFLFNEKNLLPIEL